MLPCGPVAAFWSSLSDAGTGAWNMYSSCSGIGLKAATGTPKFFAKTSGGVCAIHVVGRKVLYSEKLPSSKTSRNSVPSGSRPWIECGMPEGKFHRSPADTSATKLRPSWSKAVIRALP